MDSHTLTEKQARELGRALSTHISQGMPVGEAGDTLLATLQRVAPNSDRKWAVISLGEDEEEIYQALVNSHWPHRDSEEQEK